MPTSACHLLLTINMVADLTTFISSSDFLSNLLILLIRILNAGLSDRGLLAHLSEATAGTLSGIGHSTAYEEPATYSYVCLTCLPLRFSCFYPSSLAVKYFFMTNDGTAPDAELVIHPFNAVEEQNDYEVSARQNTGLSSFSVVDVDRSVH